MYADCTSKTMQGALEKLETPKSLNYFFELKEIRFVALYTFTDLALNSRTPPSVALYVCTYTLYTLTAPLNNLKLI